jgi:hypothetical protein
MFWPTFRALSRQKCWLKCAIKPGLESTYKKMIKIYKSQITLSKNFFNNFQSNLTIFNDLYKCLSHFTDSYLFHVWNFHLLVLVSFQWYKYLLIQTSSWFIWVFRSSYCLFCLIKINIILTILVSSKKLISDNQ